MKSNKTIAFVIPSLKAGGMERVMSELANYTSTKESIKSVLISLTNSDEFFKLNNEVEYYKPDFEFNPRRRIFGTIKLLFYLRRKLRKLRPDAVLSFGETYNSFVLLSSIGLRLKIFISDRSKPDKDWGYLHNILRKILYPHAEGIVSQTIFSKEFLYKETGHKNIIVIPNPVKTQKIDFHKRKKIILTVGRLIHSKRINILIDVFKSINLDDWELWIVGDGPCKIDLEQQVIEAKLEKQIIFWGSQKDVIKFYAQAAIFAFTSNSEGFPNALLEAIACQLPVISFDCIAGPADLISQNDIGFLINNDDIEDYRKKLQYLMEQSGVREYYTNNTAMVAKKYDIELIGDKYLNFLLS